MDEIRRALEEEKAALEAEKAALLAKIPEMQVKGLMAVTRRMTLCRAVVFASIAPLVICFTLCLPPMH